MSFYDLVYDVTKKIPKGKVATYGQIAKILNSPYASRAVGYALHLNPLPGIIPCNRVVNRFGQLSNNFAFGGIDTQRKLLQKEGIEVDNNYGVDLSKYIWKT